MGIRIRIGSGKKRNGCKKVRFDAQIKIEELKDKTLIKIMGLEYKRAPNIKQGSFNFY